MSEISLGGKSMLLIYVSVAHQISWQIGTFFMSVGNVNFSLQPARVP